jgi:hypothetical protein
LPSYSSHSYSVSVTSEVADLSQVERESAKLYAILKGSVERELDSPGLVPDGNGTSSTPRATKGHSNDQPRSNGNASKSDREWKCSPKQRDLILRVIEENKLDKRDVEKLSQQLFNAPVLTLNKLQASGLIENLLQTYGDSNPTGGNGNGNGRRQYQRGGAR